MSTFVFPRQFYNDEVGRTLPLSRLYFYETGTYNNKQVFSDKALTTPMSQPVEADGSGRFPPIYLNTDIAYRVQLKDRIDQDVGTYVDSIEPAIVPSDLGTAAYANKITSISDTTAGSVISVDYYQITATLGIGNRQLMKNVTGGSIASNATQAGSGLDIVKITTGGLVQGAGASGLAGTYKNVGGRTILNNEIGYFVRIL